jgi:hypothetical protein
MTNPQALNQAHQPPMQPQRHLQIPKRTIKNHFSTNNVKQITEGNSGQSPEGH